MITQEELKKTLQYDPITGIFTWLVTPHRGKVKAGDIAASKHNGGYLSVKIFQIKYLLHRLAWLYMKGEFPEKDIDHENGIRDDNRWKNLRKGSRAFNIQNQRKSHKHSKTGLLGVKINHNGFSASITVNGKSHHLGTFKTAELAHEAYVVAKRRLHESCTI